MTEADRQAVIDSVITALRRLVPGRLRVELDQHLLAAEVTFREQASAEYARGSADGAQRAADAAYRQGFSDGVVSVEARRDRRDLALLEDAAELRSIH